ncbi:hypothetical protein [Mycobacterium hubeiense]|uniref:hypothetical protein n=1 Tax=Mycobacterium hubeiense TaxID=1867256 RepID=UPI000C7F4AB4|nr:hypothetical protein [Mycobacterium sp. QGD 101]
MTGKSKTLAAVAVATAVPALLLSSTATAGADATDGNPDVRFDRFISNLGPGLRVTVKSHTQDPANCTYNADGITRDFFLPGFGEQTVVFNPSLPLLRNWNVNVSCDNGKSTSLTYFY